MKTTIRLLGLGLTPTLLALSALAATPKPAATTRSLEWSIRTCMGLMSTDVSVQIAACDAVIASGKIRLEHLPDYYATRAAAYLKKKQTTKALEDTNKALSMRSWPEGQFQRGLIFFIRKEDTKAKQDFDAVIKAKPSLAPPYLFTGLIEFRAGDNAGALTQFDQAVKHNATYAEALFARGVTKKLTGDKAGGDADIAQAEGMSRNVGKKLAAYGLKR